MKRSLGVFLVLGAMAVAERASAQDSVRREVKLPSGTTVTRMCARWRSEGVVVIGADARAPGGAAAEYFVQLGKAMERRLSHISPDTTVLVASFAARVQRSGEVDHIRLLKGSSSEGFDMAAQQAALIGPSSRDLLPLPVGVPDSFTVLISFGRRRDGSDFQVVHVACPAFPFPDNPKPEFPSAGTLTRTRVQVRVRYVVDTLGTVDPASLEILEPASDAFVAATIFYVSKLRYLPEDFDGVVQWRMITRPVLFIPPDEQAQGTR